MKKGQVFYDSSGRRFRVVNAEHGAFVVVRDYSWSACLTVIALVTLLVALTVLTLLDNH
jgi:hypothetical protein